MHAHVLLALMCHAPAAPIPAPLRGPANTHAHTPGARMHSQTHKCGPLPTPCHAHNDQGDPVQVAGQDLPPLRRGLGLDLVVPILQVQLCHLHPGAARPSCISVGATAHTRQAPLGSRAWPRVGVARGGKRAECVATEGQQPMPSAMQAGLGLELPPPGVLLGHISAEALLLRAGRATWVCPRRRLPCPSPPLLLHRATVACVCCNQQGLPPSLRAPASRRPRQAAAAGVVAGHKTLTRQKVQLVPASHPHAQNSAATPLACGQQRLQAAELHYTMPSPTHPPPARHLPARWSTRRAHACLAVQHPRPGAPGPCAAPAQLAFEFRSSVG